MTTLAAGLNRASTHPVNVYVAADHGPRNRLTTAFRFFLALPHLILVGGPVAATLSWQWTREVGFTPEIGAGGGVLGVVAGVCALIAWFAILFTGRYPDGLRKLVEFYLRWRVHAVAYASLLRDEYPPFGEGSYPASLHLSTDEHRPRDRLTVAFRIILAIPHLIAVWALGLVWALTTIIAWLAILFTGRYPEALYAFAVGVLRWNTRVEAYLLLLHDEYPPFSLEG